MQPYWVAAVLAGVMLSATAFPADHEEVDVPDDWYIHRHVKEEHIVPRVRRQAAHKEEEEEDEITKLKGVIGGLARQMLLTELFIEERNRGEGQSGVKKTRLSQVGTRPYHGPTHVSGSNILGIHEKPNWLQRVGLGEFSAVLNGKEFRTAFEDYYLQYPVDHKWMDGVRDIEYPDVPPEVLEKVHVSNQMNNMKLWFKAWADQDYSVRDYRPYFKPILCYLEGALLTSDHELGDDVEDSEHHKKANEWFLAQDGTRYMSYTGRSPLNLDIDYNPTSVIDSFNDSYPIFGHWHSRIVCHPLKDDLPLNRFRAVDDLSTRMSLGLTYDELAASRAARFQLNPADTDEWTERTMRHGLLDKLMEQIPGKDNYNADIEDDAFDLLAEAIDGSGPLNAGYYHRWYKVSKNDAMGVQIRHRGFADENMFVALNTRPAVATTSMVDCYGEDDCVEYRQKVSYAIPLEIIYLTPLHKWNPYGIVHKGIASSAEGQTVTADGRYGGFSDATAYNGTHNLVWYWTPSEFFSGGRYDPDPADSGSEEVGVLDKDEKMQRVSPSGTHIFLPEIEGLGNLRTRFPIMPLYNEGNSLSKELEALKDIVMQPNTYFHMHREKPDCSPDNTPPPGRPNICLEMRLSQSGSVSPHIHVIVVSPDKQDDLHSGGRVRFDTTLDNGHMHDLMVDYDVLAETYSYYTCDGNDECWDEHPKGLLFDGECN